MNQQNDIYIFDNRDRKALEARLMELSDLFWDLFEQKRLAAILPDRTSSSEIPVARGSNSGERKILAY